MLYIVDTERESSLIHRVDVENGIYLMPRRVHGTFQDQARAIVQLIEKEEPSQIVFDRSGYGIGVADIFPMEMYNMRAYFEVDIKGNITHTKM